MSADGMVRRCSCPASTAVKGLLLRQAGVCSGSLASFSAHSPNVCLSPDSGGIADIPEPLLGPIGDSCAAANTRLLDHLVGAQQESLGDHYP
jgi:hypothetical protein